MYIYGIINKDNCLIDISRNEKSCKRYATLNGYNKIGCRNVNSYNAMLVAEKVDGRWQSIEV